MMITSDERRFLKRVQDIRENMQRPPRTFADLKAGDKVWVFSMYYGYSKLSKKRQKKVNVVYSYEFLLFTDP